jgi:hypothetical protein
VSALLQLHNQFFHHPHAPFMTTTCFHILDQNPIIASGPFSLSFGVSTSWLGIRFRVLPHDFGSFGLVLWYVA